MAGDSITIDGSLGEGGGQIVRSSLALSLVTGRPITLERIRAGRKKPGLRRQHLTAVQAARRISGAHAAGAEIGSAQLVFHPGRVTPGEYTFRIGSAGSTTLVLQTVLPALMIADGPSTVILEGGTHNPLAPPYDFLAHAYLPLLRRMGVRVESSLQRPGFYPAGGGRFSVSILPCRQLDRLELLERGEIQQRSVRAIVANLPHHIAQRECETIAQRTNWKKSCFAVEEAPAAPGPGNVVMIQLKCEHVNELFAGFGQRGVRAETVATRVLKETRRYIDADVPVGQYLADQLMLPLGIGAHQGGGGGAFRTLPLSLHSTTHLDILQKFLNVRVERNRDTSGGETVCIEPGP
jgi:RNA 3'-terminal phosphate cyclase (ATP)